MDLPGFSCLRFWNLARWWKELLRKKKVCPRTYLLLLGNSRKRVDLPEKSCPIIPGRKKILKFFFRKWVSWVLKSQFLAKSHFSNFWTYLVFALDGSISLVFKTFNRLLSFEIFSFPPAYSRPPPPEDPPFIRYTRVI